MRKRVLAVILAASIAYAPAYIAYAESYTVTIGTSVLITANDADLGGIDTTTDKVTNLGVTGESISAENSNLSTNASDLIGNYVPGLTDPGGVQGSTLTKTTMTEQEFLDYMKKLGKDMNTKYQQADKKNQDNALADYEEALAKVEEAYKKNQEALEAARTAGDDKMAEIDEEYKQSLQDAYDDWVEDVKKEIYDSTLGNEDYMEQNEEINKTNIANAEENKDYDYICNHTSDISDSEYENVAVNPDATGNSDLFLCKSCQANGSDNCTFGYYSSCDCGLTLPPEIGARTNFGLFGAFGNFIDNTKGWDEDGNFVNEDELDETTQTMYYPMAGQALDTCCQICGNKLNASNMFGGYIVNGRLRCADCIKADGQLRYADDQEVSSSEFRVVRYDYYADDGSDIYDDFDAYAEEVKEAIDNAEPAEAPDVVSNLPEVKGLEEAKKDLEDQMKKLKEEMEEKKKQLENEYPSVSNPEELVKNSDEYSEAYKYIFGDWPADQSQWSQKMKDLYKQFNEEYANNKKLWQQLEDGGVFDNTGGDAESIYEKLQSMYANETAMEDTVTLNPVVEWNGTETVVETAEGLSPGSGYAIEINQQTGERTVLSENFGIGSQMFWYAGEIGTFQILRYVTVYRYSYRKVQETGYVYWVANYNGEEIEIRPNEGVTADGSVEITRTRIDNLGTNEQEGQTVALTPITIQVTEGQTHLDIGDDATERIANDLTTWMDD